QELAGPARDLLAKYSAYLEDKVSADIREADSALATAQRTVAAIANTEIDGFIDEFSAHDDKPEFFAPVRAIELMRAIVADATLNRGPVEHDVSKGVTNHRTSVDTALAAASADIANLEEQFQNRQSALADNESELAELTAAAELARSWIGIETQ